MVAAIVIAMIVMYAASGPVSRFVAEHPTTKMLALAFLVLIGVALVADGVRRPRPAATSTSRWRFAAASNHQRAPDRNRRPAR